MTRWRPIVLAVCLLAAACGDDNGTSPSNAPIVFTASLSPANEVPAIGNAEAGGRGSVQITIDQATRVPTFFIQLTGFPADSRMTAAHIHTGGAGVNGGIVVNSGIASSVLSTSINEVTSTGQAIDPTLLQTIVSNPAAYYFNVHSSLNPGGFARGQLVRTQ